MTEKNSLNKFIFKNINKNYLCPFCTFAVGFDDIEKLSHDISYCKKYDNFAFHVYFIDKKSKIKITTILLESVFSEYEDEFNSKIQIFDGYKLRIKKKFESYNVIKKNIFNNDELLMKKFFILFFRVNVRKIKPELINNFLEKDIEKIDPEDIHKIMKKEFNM